ncbi:MAG: PBP1A family penicillin-binding protein [Christensenellaceae bacterium]|nr:PBP1A family penicillin-binding protein [Christensenellaceae bacterium]
MKRNAKWRAKPQKESDAWESSDAVLQNFSEDDISDAAVSNISDAMVSDTSDEMVLDTSYTMVSDASEPVSEDASGTVIPDPAESADTTECDIPDAPAHSRKPHRKREKHKIREKRKARGKRKRHIAWKVALTLVLLLIASAVAVFIHFFKVDEWHEFDASLITCADRSVCVYDAQGELRCVVAGGENRIPIALEDLPEYVKYAFISAEDARFYEHKGVDIVRIFGAAWADIKSGSFDQGASTIGQQLIKLSHLTTKKTFERKLEEAYLSLRMESQFNKDEILEMYLNYVYFGGGFYGIETAALGYFGVHAKELSPAQAAQLAGILKSPNKYAPHLNFQNSVDRRNNVLRLMNEYGHLSDEDYAFALEEECVLKNAIPTERSYYIDYALNEASQKLGMSKEDFLVSGCSVITAIDGEANDECEALINEGSLFPAQDAQGALVLLRTDGSIAAMCGGRGEYSALGFNRAADAERQPGSLIKPVLCYAPAIELYGYTAASVFDDSPRSFGDYTPRNSNDTYLGNVTMRTAVAKSLNIPAVEVLSNIGLPSAVMFAQNLGISFENENYSLSLALGGFKRGVSPLEIAGAYAAFASGGVYTEPYSVLKIEQGGRVLYEAEPRSTRAMSEETAYIITSMLETAATEGTADVLSELSFPIAAKTGTSLAEDGSVRDAWSAAYTRDYTAVMWMGMDSSEQGSLPKGTTGGNSACPILKELFARLYEDDAPSEFTIPAGIRRCAIDAYALENEQITLLATEYTPEERITYEYFSESAAPTEANAYWLYPSPPSRVGWYRAENGSPIICFNSEDERLSYRIYRTAGGGEEVLVAELGGQVGPVEFTDANAVSGTTYVYTVRTVHPEILDEGGVNAESEDSRRMRVYIAGW